jgi:hypothetical protein
VVAGELLLLLLPQADRAVAATMTSSESKVVVQGRGLRMTPFLGMSEPKRPDQITTV